MVGAGADWPNWFTPREMPLNPTYFNQPKVDAASTETRASTSGGRTESCKTQQLQHSMSTTSKYQSCRQMNSRPCKHRRSTVNCPCHKEGNCAAPMIVTLYCWSCSSNSSQETMETTRHFLPSFSSSLAASTANPSSVPVASTNHN